MVGDAVVWYGVTIAAPVLDGFLPLTEAVQRLSSVVVDLQRGLLKRHTRGMHLKRETKFKNLSVETRGEIPPASCDKQGSVFLHCSRSDVSQRVSTEGRQRFIVCIELQRHE